MDCVAENADSYEPECVECGTVSELYECPICGDGQLCEDCLRNHIESNHLDYKEKNYEDYVSEEVAKEL